MVQTTGGKVGREQSSRSDEERDGGDLPAGTWTGSLGRSE